MFTTVITYKPSIELLADMRARIDKGFDWMVKMYGTRWDRGIDLSKLRMESGCLCVCGQKFANKALGVNAQGNGQDNGFGVFCDIVAPNRRFSAQCAVAAEYGMSLSRNEMEYNMEYNRGALWNTLGDLWAEKLRRYRKSQKRNQTKG